jgi:hypothetical protein
MRPSGMIALAMVMLAGCAGGPSEPGETRTMPRDRGQGSSPADELPQADRAGGWSIPFADDDGSIVTRVGEREVGLVEFHTDGPTEILVEIEVDVDPGVVVSAVEIGWSDGQPTHAPAAAETPRCEPVDELLADVWARRPLLYAGLSAEGAGRYFLELEHACPGRQISFTTRPVEARRDPGGVVGAWSMGWLPDDAGWRAGPFVPAWIDVLDDGEVHHCLLYDVDDATTTRLRWEPRGEGLVAIRAASGATAAPETWRIGDRLVLLDPTAGPMIDWLPGLSTSAAPSSVGWTADWGDILVARPEGARPGACDG